MELQVNKRQAGKVKNLLRENKLPGIVYGRHLESPIMVQFDKNEFLKLYKKAGSSSVITLKGDGIEQMALIHDLQLEPVKDTVIHVDFLAVKKGEKVKAEVPVIIEGEEVLEKLGLKVNLISDYIEVEAIPSKLPKNIKIDVSNLKEDDNIHIKDINLGDDVEILADKEEVILVVYNPEEEIDKEEENENIEEGEENKEEE